MRGMNFGESPPTYDSVVNHFLKISLMFVRFEKISRFLKIWVISTKFQKNFSDWIFKMAEDLGDEWWETKNSKNDKNLDEGLVVFS